LSDYKGKLVVVDVWATWCEPCRRMMPLFHELQKEFAGKNVEFLSVCVGVWIESEKWLQLSNEFHIKQNNFFISGWQSDFVKDYRISGVPRYMIFDREGKIVSLNATNPTSDKLKEMILKNLQD
jgi:thiol-disulfide isomerase/thioredoxin